MDASVLMEAWVAEGNANGDIALRLITDHLEHCARTHREVAESVREVRNLLLSFISAVFAVVVAFSGYTYVHDQNLAEQLTQTRLSTERIAAQK